MSKQEEINVSSKHIWLRVILFILALVTAVAAFTKGVLGIGHKETGYQTIEAKPSQEAVMFDRDIVFRCYFSGGSDEIKHAVNELSAVYSPLLLRVYELLDAETEYPGLTNIATLNAHIGEDMALSEELYRVLLDAQEISRAQQGYNLFDGAFFRAWRNIRYLGEPADYDPLRNETERERLALLCEAGQDPDNFRLTVVDADRHVLRLEVSESYLALLSELEQEGPILDLGLLHDAYELRLLSEALEKAGYKNGYLSMDSGLTAVLSENPMGTHCLYGRTEEGVTPAAEIPAVGGRSACMMRAFAEQEGEPDYYELDGHLRHPWLPADGEYRDQLLAALVVADDPVKAACLTLRLQTLPDAQALLAAAAEEPGAELALILNDGTKTVYAGGEAFTARDDYGWRLERIGGA